MSRNPPDRSAGLASGNLSCLTELDLSLNELAILPESLGNLTALTTLNLSGDQLTVLPALPGQPDFLTTLNAGSYLNRHWSLGRRRPTQAQQPVEGSAGVAGQPDRPHHAQSRRQPATVLPESLGNLTALTTLNLSGNQPDRLPGVVG